MQQAPRSSKNQRQTQRRIRRMSERRRRNQRCDQNGNGNNESCNRSGNADVHERGAIRNWRTNADESPKGADNGWSGQKERQRSIDVMALGIRKVTHLVRQQNAQKRRAEWNAEQQPRR